MILQFKGKNVDVLIEIVETGEQFETRSECAKKLGVHVSSISQALNARVKTVAGYHLRYIKGYIVYYLTPDILNELADVSVAPYEEWCNRSQNMIHAVKKGLAKTERVIVTETGKEYSSSVECARAIGGTVSGIHDCKSRRQKVHRGYHFIFPEDYDE